MSKIERQHLERKAYVYVRQSTMAQVERNVESRERQYELAERAVSLGWARRRWSCSTATRRARRRAPTAATASSSLVAEVGLGQGRDRGRDRGLAAGAAQRRLVSGCLICAR